MDDKQIILSLGGPTKVAAILGFDKSSGPQRVHNWMERGIPAKEKLKRPDLFPFDTKHVRAMYPIPGAPIDGKKVREAKNGTRRVQTDTRKVRT